MIVRPEAAGDSFPAMSPVLRRSLALLLGVGLSAALVEGGVAWLAPQPGLPEVGLLRGMLTEPGDHRVATGEYRVTVHVNREGFVDREWGPKRGPRVVLLGDSFVQAAQVEPGEGVGRRLEEALGVEVLSMGVPGAGTGTELGVLERWGLAQDPDVVLLGFLVANDVLNNSARLDTRTDKPFYRLAGGRLVRTDPTAAAAPLPWLWERSQAFRLLARAWTARVVAAEKVAAGDGVPLDFHVYRPTHDPRWDEAWAITDALLRALAARVEASGARFGVLLFADQLQATAGGLARARADWPAMADWDPLVAHGRARALAESVAPTCDLLPALQAADRAGERLFYARDGHWTAQGHRRAAEAAAPCVRALLPPDAPAP